MKFSLTLIILLSIFKTASAQLAVGFQGGPNFASVQFRNRNEFLFRNVKLIETYQFGAVVRYASEKHAAFQLEFNVSQKGWRDVNDTSNVEYKRVINYYEVPFLTQFNIGGKKVKIILEGGPYVAYANKAEEEFKDAGTGEVISSNSFDFVDKVDNRWDYGLMARAGLQFKFLFGAFEAKAFYSYGYGNLFLEKQQALELSQNRVYGVIVGYVFYFGKEKEEPSNPE